jgi:hypothetical protein
VGTVAGYDAINHGRIEIDRLRTTLAGLPLPRAANGRIALAVDVSHWLRPDAACSPEVGLPDLRRRPVPSRAPGCGAAGFGMVRRRARRRGGLASRVRTESA